MAIILFLLPLLHEFSHRKKFPFVKSCQKTLGFCLFLHLLGVGVQALLCREGNSSLGGSRRGKTRAAPRDRVGRAPLPEVAAPRASGAAGVPLWFLLSTRVATAQPLSLPLPALTFGMISLSLMTLNTTCRMTPQAVEPRPSSCSPDFRAKTPCLSAECPTAPSGLWSHLLPAGSSDAASTCGPWDHPHPVSSCSPHTCLCPPASALGPAIPSSGNTLPLGCHG